MNRTKVITLAISVLSSIAIGGTAYTGTLPPNWAAISLTSVAGIYGMIRTLQKMRAGATFKSLLATSEGWGAGIAIVATIVASVKGVVSPAHAVAAGTIAVVLTAVARALQGGKLPPPATPAVALAFAVLLSTGIGCHNTKPDQFFGAVVDCAKVNPQSSAALASVESCLLGLMSQNTALCLSGLVTDGHFAIDEIACLVAHFSQKTQERVAMSSADSKDYKIRQAANDWLVQERIGIRNTYPGQ